MEKASHRWNGRWIIGGCMIIVGSLILMMNFGVIDRFPFWKFWPLILIVIGLKKFVEPYYRAEGFWFISLGLWLQWSVLRLYGFGFHDTWPVVLILYGIYWMWNSIERETRKRTLREATMQTSTH